MGDFFRDGFLFFLFCFFNNRLLLTELFNLKWILCQVVIICRHNTGALLELGAFYVWVIHRSVLSDLNIPLKTITKHSSEMVGYLEAIYIYIYIYISHFCVILYNVTKG